MPEKQNEDKVILGNIWKEIKSMRKEAEIQHRHTLYFSGFAISSAVALLGVSIYTMTLVSPCWQAINGIGIMILGLASAGCCLVKKRKLRKEQKEMHKETKNG